MIINVSAQKLYILLKSTNIIKIVFTVQLTDKTASCDNIVATSDIDNSAVKLCIAAYTDNEDEYKATIDFTDFDEVENRIMAKSALLLLALNQNTSLQSFTFQIDKTHYGKKLYHFFTIFYKEILIRVETNNKQYLSELFIYGTEKDWIHAKKNLNIPIIKFIKKAPNLKVLALIEMNLMDDDVIPILTFLHHNKIMLTELELTNNNLSNVAIKQIFKYIREVRSLVSLDISGQTPESRFIFDGVLFQYMLSTLSILPHRMNCLGLANLSIDDCAFQFFYYEPDIVVNKIRHLDISDNQLSYQMIVHAENVFKKLDDYFDFQYDECCPESILYSFMWNDEELIPDLLNECTVLELSDIDSNKNTPAHYLAQHGNLDGLKQLKILGALLKKENHKGFTPLHTAIEHNQIKIVDWFMHTLKPIDLNKVSFVMALAASDNIDMFNLFKIKLKNRFKNFLNLTFNELTFCHILATYGAIKLLSHALETKLITKIQLEARCQLKKDDKKTFSSLILGLVIANIDKSNTIDIFKLMISQRVEIKNDDLAIIMTYVKKFPEKLSWIQETLHDQIIVYQNLKAVFDIIWRQYAIIFDSEILRFIITISQTDLCEKFNVRRNFLIIVDSVLKYLFKTDVDRERLCVFNEKNTATLTIIKSDLNQKINIDGLKQSLIALKSKSQMPNPSEKPKQKNKETCVPKSKLEPTMYTPPPADILTTVADTTTDALPSLETIIYQNRDLFKTSSQKKMPALSKQNPSHGQGKNSKNLKRREKYNKKIEKETAKEQLKLQREQHRLRKEAERTAKAQQKAENDHLAQQAQLAKEDQLTVEASETTIPKLTDITQGFFYQRKHHSDDSDGEELLKILDDELMKLKEQLIEDTNHLGF